MVLSDNASGLASRQLGADGIVFGGIPSNARLHDPMVIWRRRASGYQGGLELTEGQLVGTATALSESNSLMSDSYGYRAWGRPLLCRGHQAGTGHNGSSGGGSEISS